MGTWLIVVCAVSCGAVLGSERAGSRLGVWIAKPLAAACFVALGAMQVPFDPTYARLVVAGLCLSWLGDVLLIPSARPTLFLLGIAAFLSAHVAYCAAFVSVGMDSRGLLVSAVFVLPAALATLRWLLPRLGGVFAVAVPVYVVVIGAMVVASAGTAQWLGRPDMLVAAAGFAASDIAVARERFVSPSFVNGAWGLPLYFAAQCLFALSIAAR
jgi:uncharacterized membrane protein YhhN